MHPILASAVLLCRHWDKMTDLLKKIDKVTTLQDRIIIVNTDMKEATFITPEGWKKLNKEMEELWEERKQVTEAVSEAAAMGDRSENAEYIYGKKRLRELDRKIGFIHKRFKILKVHNPEVRDTSIVAFGAYETFYTN